MLKSLCLSFLLILALSFEQIYAGENHDEETFNNIFFLIYNNQFEKAEQQLILSKTFLSHLNYEILQLDLIWWKALNSNNENEFTMLEKKLSAKLKDLSKSERTTKLEELIYLNYLFRIAAMRSQTFKMFQYFFAINKIIERFEPAQLTKNEINFYNLYKSVFTYGKSKLFFRSEIKTESLKTLNDYVSSSNVVFYTISNYFLAKIYLELENSPVIAKVYYVRLIEKFPENKIFKLYFEACN